MRRRSRATPVSFLRPLILALSASALFLTGQSVEGQTSHKPSQSQGTPDATMLNINRAAAWYTSYGSQERRPDNGNSGLTYPRGTSTAIYAAGFLYGGKFRDGKTPALRVNGSVYNNGMKPGRILSLRTGESEDALASDARIWRVREDYATADLRQDAAELNDTGPDSVTQEQVASLRAQYETDWREWPAQKGAPFYDAEGDGQYRPRFTGDSAGGVAVPVLFPEADEPGLASADQIVWFVMNDIQVEQPWECPESGIELQVTIWGYDRADPLGDAIFKSCRLIYKGTSGTPADATIDSMYIAQWSDPDIGDSGDDFAGCDSMLSLGYAYNGDPDDIMYAEFNLPPPAAGYVFVQGALVPGVNGEDRNRNGIDDGGDHGVRGLRQFGPGMVNLPLTSFWYGSSSPLTEWYPTESYRGAIKWYRALRGLPIDPMGLPDLPEPPPLIDPTTGEPTLYWLSGDPVAGQGWLDGSIDNPGDRMVLLPSGPFSMAVGDTQEIVVAWVGGLGRDHKNSVELLKSNAAFVQAYFDSALVVSGIQESTTDLPVSFRLEQNFPNPFNPSTTIRYGLPIRSQVTLTVFNTLGQKVATLVAGEQEAGDHEVRFNGSSLASGMYLYRLQAGGFVQAKKLVVLQ